MLTSDVWAATGLALCALAIVALLLALVPRTRALPILVPLGLGYVLGEGALGLLDSELASRTAFLALEIGAGWIALEASLSALATLKRSPTRSAVYWALAYALVGPSILAAGLSPLAVSIFGAGGLALHALATTGVAGALPDPSNFKSTLLAGAVTPDKLREAVRTSDALHAAVLAVFPVYWGAARSMAQGEWLLVDSVIASVAASFALGLSLGFIGYLLIKYLKWGLAIAALLIFLTIKAAILGELFQISAIATCFIAGAVIGQNLPQRKNFTDVVRNLRRPFFFLMLLAAGAVAPAWRGFVPALLIIAVVLIGRFVIGKIADTLASTSPNVGSGRQFAWLVAIPSALSVAIVAESLLILGSPVGTDVQSASAALPAQLAGVALRELRGEHGFVSLVAPFLLAVGIADILGRRLLLRGYPGAISRAKHAAAAHVAEHKRRHRGGSRRRSHKS